MVNGEKRETSRKCGLDDQSDRKLSGWRSGEVNAVSSVAIFRSTSCFLLSASYFLLPAPNSISYYTSYNKQSPKVLLHYSLLFPGVAHWLLNIHHTIYQLTFQLGLYASKKTPANPCNLF